MIWRFFVYAKSWLDTRFWKLLSFLLHFITTDSTISPNNYCVRQRSSFPTFYYFSERTLLDFHSFFKAGKPGRPGMHGAAGPEV